MLRDIKNEMKIFGATDAWQTVQLTNSNRSEIHSSFFLQVKKKGNGIETGNFIFSRATLILPVEGGMGVRCQNETGTKSRVKARN